MDAALDARDGIVLLGSGALYQCLGIISAEIPAAHRCDGFIEGFRGMTRVSRGIGAESPPLTNVSVSSTRAPPSTGFNSSASEPANARLH